MTKLLDEAGNVVAEAAPFPIFDGGRFDMIEAGIRLEAAGVRCDVTGRPIKGSWLFWRGSAYEIVDGRPILRLR